MPLLYVIDIYYRPEGQTEPSLWKAMRIMAQNDADAVREAEMSFKSLVADRPSLTGFSLRRVGFRRGGDRIIHMQNAAGGQSA
jgi:hypothetical protein